jgi:hypothetical protein
MDTTDLIKTLFPLVTFVFGVMATPVVETIKEKSKWNALRKNLILELEDELSELPKRLEKMSATLDGLQRIKDKSIQPGNLFKYIPRKTEVYFLKASAEAIFRSLNKNQRYAVKSLLTQIEALESYVKSMKSMEVSDETIDECINNAKRYLYTGASTLNTMRIIAMHQSAVLSFNDNEIVNKVLSENGVDLTTEDLIIKGKAIFL